MSVSAAQIERDLEAFKKANGHYGWDSALEAESRKKMTVPKAVFSAAAMAVDPKDLPESMGVKGWYRCEYQGGVGRCAGEARAGSSEIDYYRATKGDVIQLSPSYAYQTAQEFDGLVRRGDVGSTVSGNAQMAHDKGTCRDELWNPSSYQHIPSNLRAQLDADAKNQRIEAYKELHSYEEVLAWLVSGVGGIAIGVPWANGGCWHRYNAQGVITRFYRSPMSGGHSMLWGDWDKRFCDPQGWPAITMFNSHGKDYGDQGRVYLMRSVVEAVCQASDCDVFGYSGMIDIKPREYDWAKGKHFV